MTSIRQHWTSLSTEWLVSPRNVPHWHRRRCKTVKRLQTQIKQQHCTLCIWCRPFAFPKNSKRMRQNIYQTRKCNNEASSTLLKNSGSYNKIIRIVLMSKGSKKWVKGDEPTKYYLEADRLLETCSTCTEQKTSITTYFVFKQTRNSSPNSWNTLFG